MSKYQFVTALHGNEIMPTLALASASVSQIIANPRALARGVRFIEKDLNASFGTSGNSYEELRARELIDVLDRRKLVIDFHTFPCESDPFAIIVDLKMLPLASTLGLKHVVYMKYNIKGGHALINHFHGLSVEVGGHKEESSFTTTQMIVHRLGSKTPRRQPVRVYEVFGKIEKKGKYHNFVEHDGVIPVLYGESIFYDYGCYGLKAREITGTI